jgi:hypothetical protein
MTPLLKKSQQNSFFFFSNKNKDYDLISVKMQETLKYKQLYFPFFFCFISYIYIYSDHISEIQAPMGRLIAN